MRATIASQKLNARTICEKFHLFIDFRGDKEYFFMSMKEKAPPTKPLRVSEEIHQLVKQRAIDTKMSMQEVTEFSIRMACERKKTITPLTKDNPIGSVWSK